MEAVEYVAPTPVAVLVTESVDQNETLNLQQRRMIKEAQERDRLSNQKVSWNPSKHKKNKPIPFSVV